VTAKILFRHWRARSTVTPNVLGTRPAMMLIPYWWQNSTASTGLLDGPTPRCSRPRTRRPASQSRTIPGGTSSGAAITTRSNPSRIALTGGQRPWPSTSAAVGVTAKMSWPVSLSRTDHVAGYLGSRGHARHGGPVLREGTRRQPRHDCHVGSAPVAWSLGASQPSLSGGDVGARRVWSLLRTRAALSRGDRDHGSVRAHFGRPRCPAGEPLS
jgi:hypothetical protein